MPPKLGAGTVAVPPDLPPTAAKIALAIKALMIILRISAKIDFVNSLKFNLIGFSLLSVSFMQ